ncbi:MAG: hypothetical protein JNK58_14195 [Phycisphaerae bacterium]|nr:hypothetical protein [Phycisphaerae bacterium]
MRRFLCRAGVIGSLLLQASSQAAVTYVSQYRAVEAHERLATYDWVWAPDFDPFSAHITGIAADFFLGHDSRLDPTEVRFTGEVRGVGGSHTGGTWNMITSQTVVDVEFDLDVATPFDAAISATGTNLWNLESRLETSPAGVPIFSGQGVFTGMLDPGRYRFLAVLDATGLHGFDPDSGAEFALPSTAQIDATLRLPSPGGAVVSTLVLLGMSRRRRAPLA